MPPPEIWGPATWTLFHCLAEKVNEHMYPRIAGQLFDIIKRLCSALPCPECAQDATIFLRKIKINELRSKNDFKNMVYMFHNYVNAKKRKPLYKYSDLEIYKKYNIVFVFNRFISVYHTKGNMRLLAESFQRLLIIRTVREWFRRNVCFFVPCQQAEPAPVSAPSEIVTTPVVEPVVGISSEEIVPINEIEEPEAEEPIIQEPIIQEPVAVPEVEPVAVPEVEPIIQEPVIQEPIIQEPIAVPEVEPIAVPEVEPIIQEPIAVPEVEPVAVPEAEPITVEPIAEEPIAEEPIAEEPIAEEPIAEENVLSEEEPLTEETVSETKEQTKPKRGRKKKVV